MFYIFLKNFLASVADNSEEKTHSTMSVPVRPAFQVRFSNTYFPDASWPETKVLYCIVEGSRRLMPPDALQPKAYCTNPGL